MEMMSGMMNDAVGAVPRPFQVALNDVTAKPGGAAGCVLAVLCTPCTYAEVTAEVHGNGEEDCVKHAVGLTLLSPFFPLIQGYTRTKVYEKYNILDLPGGLGKQSLTEGVAACCCWFMLPCIPLAMICQEVNEVKLREGRLGPQEMAEQKMKGDTGAGGSSKVGAGG